MLSVWQQLPLQIDPIAFSIGFFSVHWYALFLLFGFFAATLFCQTQVEHGNLRLSKDEIFDLALVVFLGALIGGRIGFALLYMPDYFIENPLALILPYDFDARVWIGISGMSFHGGLVGAVVALYWFSQKKKMEFWKITDLVALSIPLALFFGRLGNFMNSELYGRMTEKPWGMYFLSPVAIELRHPSALYEALFEGVVLFVLLLVLRRYASFSGYISSLFLILYAFFRFILEYFREPDSFIGLFLGILTRGQAFSLVLLLVGMGIFVWLKGQKNGSISLKA